MFRYLRLPIIKKEQGYCGNPEKAVLRGAVGQYNVIAGNLVLTTGLKT